MPEPTKAALTLLAQINSEREAISALYAKLKGLQDQDTFNKADPDTKKNLDEAVQGLCRLLQRLSEND